MKKALITGITGQDGSYLAELLLDKGYDVYGLIRRTSNKNVNRIEHLLDKISLVDGDLTDQNSLNNCIKEVMPDECYNLGAQSFVKESWNSPEYTMNVNSLGCLRLLESIRQFSPHTKFYQASSSEMFGKVQETPQNENTKFYPRSPYGISKVSGYWTTINYRESYGLFGCNGILFNHESPRRGLEFVTRKISDGVARIMLGLDKYITLGNLKSKRDWGFAGDYVRGMYLMLQQDKPDDFVISTGETYSVEDFVRESFKCVGIDDWKYFVRQDSCFMRPAEVNLLLGDSSKAYEKLGWEPSVDFKGLVKMMVKNDIDLYRRGVKK